MLPRTTLQQWVEQLQSEGRYTFTRSEAENRSGRSYIATQTALRRLKEKGRIASPRRGFYVVIPPEYRVAGSPPASWYIDELMGFVNQTYYVGLLSAAAYYGAGHQQPMTFQVVAEHPIRPMQAGRVAVQFFMNNKVAKMPVTEVQTETGTMRVGTPEVTAFDLVRYPSGVGGLSNAAMILSEMGSRIEPDKLLALAPLLRFPDTQRLGFLLDAVGESNAAEPLANWIKEQQPRTVLLNPRGLKTRERNPRWRLLANQVLELDL